MNDRTELLAATLNSLPEGIAVLAGEGEVLFWNQAAEAITGFTAMDLLRRAIPEGLEPLLECTQHGDLHWCADQQSGRGALVRVRHKLGHEVPSIARVVVLRDELGERIGAAAVFHPAESLDALPHGETDQDESVMASQADLEERLRNEFDDFLRGDEPFGVLWISVDQAPELRKTHGAGACQAMLEKVSHALAVGLRPAEELGCWGDDEFLVIAHERTREMLDAHARVLAGLARTADFRWWGDRISITISIGAAQAAHAGETLSQLLECAREAMQSSIRSGGNCVTSAPGRLACLPS